MGFGGGKSAPDVPDPMDLTRYQTGANWGTTLASNKSALTGTYTPYGTTSWEKGKKIKYTDPYTGEKYKGRTWNERITLSPGEQAKYDALTGAQTQALGAGNARMGELSNPFSFGDPDLGVNAYTPGGDLSGEAWSGDPLKLGNEATEARLYELGSKRLDPDFARRQNELQASLIGRGIREGSAAWNAAMNQFSEGRNDAYNNLLLTGRAQATDELSREWQSGLAGNQQRFGQLVGARELGMAEQGQQFGQTLQDRMRRSGEALSQRQQAVSEIAQLLGFGTRQQGINMPSLVGRNPQPFPVTDIAALINDNWDKQFKAWQAESQLGQGKMGSVLGLAGDIIASDERIKDDMKVVGKTAEGLPVYEFRIGDGPLQTGVSAQDVEKISPEAVVEGPGGVKGVNYSAAVGTGDGTYRVEKGDNLWEISQRFNVPVEDIVAANNIETPDYILPGQELVIPGMAAPGPEAIPLAALPPGGPAVVAAALQSPPPGGRLTAEEGVLDAIQQRMIEAKGGVPLPPSFAGNQLDLGSVMPPPPPMVTTGTRTRPEDEVLDAIFRNMNAVRGGGAPGPAYGGF